MDSAQKGISLISMMIGLLLASLVMLAMMFAYRAVVRNGMQAIINGRMATESAGSLLVAESSLQQAGWGIGASLAPPGAAANTDVVLLSGATYNGSALTGAVQTITSSPASGNAIVWDESLNGYEECSALVASGNGLQKLGPVACGNAASFSGLSWSNPVMLVQAGVLSAPATFAVSRMTCWPFSAAPNGAAQNVVQVTIGGIGLSSPSVCLVNVTH